MECESLLHQADRFADERHSGQSRKDARCTAYIEHPRAVMRILKDVGKVADQDVLIAGLLHDVIEDTPTSSEELCTRFGNRISRIVQEVSDDKRLPKMARKYLQIKGAPFVSREAKLVKLADKICNLKDILESPPEGWSIERKREYFRWAKAVVDGLRGVNVPLEAEFDRIYERMTEITN